jgi:hypothetical protein
MSTTTPNLSLFKILPREDAKKVFNFNEILNSNWDKIDLLPEQINQAIEIMTAKMTAMMDAVYRIGQPIIRLDDYINEEFEVRLEGGEKRISDFPELYEVYGNTYGSTHSGYFKLPDFRNRTFWVSEDFGYLAAGLPNIKGSATISGAFINSGNGAIWGTGNVTNRDDNLDDKGTNVFHFDASRNDATAPQANGIYRNDCYTVQPPAIKVRVVTRFK